MGVARVVASAAVLLAAVGTGEAVAPGSALAAPEAQGAKTIRLVLTVAKGESTRPAQRRASLTCQPPGGSHQKARTACTELAKVGGRFDKLQSTGTACMDLWDPVTVTANGTWKGRKIAYTHTFSNGCVLGTNTGSVFSL